MRHVRAALIRHNIELLSRTKRVNHRTIGVNQHVPEGMGNFIPNRGMYDWLKGKLQVG